MGSLSETVCVTGAAGFIGSWLVMRLIERGYMVRATVRDPGPFFFFPSFKSLSQFTCFILNNYSNKLIVSLDQGFQNFMFTFWYADNMKKVKHLLELPGANSRLSLWKADLDKEGSFDEAIKGCTGVFHVATPMDFESKDPEVYMLNNT
jgi:bifunctional dihydroflavonol 4-reductase/flavanone 4-reductase